ncbi:NACHT domain-containing protein [Dactylonectria macrodidyma]|uniref:NACHT domain-containing protein n=1 Tax=Dactylonectria macrodidyma TaxID=307937 RepID=A0A9P9FTV7_9HYPO|nr:NACHT domain-containing protein [Dactylonectria macrodidyma]
MAARAMDGPIVAAGQKFLDSLDEKDRSIVTLCTSADIFTHHFEQLGAVRNAQAGAKKRIVDSIAVFSDNVEPYLKAIDTLVSSKPEVAALIWGAAKLVLLVANNYSNFFRKLTDMLESISSNFAIYKSLVEVLEENDIELTPGLRCAIVTTYSGILNFFQKIVRVFYKKKGKAKAKPLVVGDLLLRPFDSTFSTLQEKLSSCDALVDKELQLYQLKLILQCQQNNAEEPETDDDTQSSDDLREHLTAIEALVDSVKKAVKERHIDDIKNDIRQWINPPEFMRIYESAIDEMEENTAGWLFQKDEYKSWESFEVSRIGAQTEPEQADAQGSVLWIHGKPGSGKTFLAASVIDRLKASARRDKHRVVLFFHFDAEDGTSNNTASAYRSLLSQLFQRYSKSPDMIDRFSFSMADSHGQKTASMFELADLLNLCISTLEDKCFIILDGIDECDDDGRFVSGLLGTISNCPSVRLLVFSRPTVTLLNDQIPQKERIPIADANRGDIQHYLERKIESFIERDYLPPSADKARLLDHLTIGANGMFLWAYLIIKYLDTDAIDQESRVSAIFDITMPDDLEKMYSRILQRIQDSNSAERNMATKVFSWLIYAARPGPFRPEELQVALNPTANVQLEPARFVQTIVRVCGSLVELGADGQFHFIHLSVKEYLSTQPNGFKQPLHRVHAMLAASYLEYLTMRLPAEPLTADLHEPSRLLAAYPLAFTAVSHWMQHCVHAFLCVVKHRSGEKVFVDADNVGDLVEMLIPKLRKLLDNKPCFLVWIDISYRLSVRIWNSIIWKPSLDDLSLYFTHHSCGIHADTVSRILTDLVNLLLCAEEIQREWGAQLLHDPSTLWGEVAAFHKLSECPLAEVMKVTSLQAERPETGEAGQDSLKTISRVRSDGKAIMVLSVWPSRCFEEVAVRSGAELRGRNLWGACSGWVAKYETWTTEEEPACVLSVVTKLNAEEVLIQCKQSAWEDCDSLPASRPKLGHISSPWRFQFPLGISPSGRYFCILRTVYEVLRPETEHCRPRLRKRKLNVDFDERDNWDPCRRVEYDMSAPRFLYFPTFTTSEDLFVLVSKLGAPLGLALFQTRLGEDFQPTLKVSDQSDILVSSEGIYGITICHNLALPLIGFIAGPGAYVWDWTRTEKPKIHCCFSSVIDEPETIAFSGCGKFLVLRLQANIRQIAKDMEQLLGTERLLELQQMRSAATNELLNIMERVEYGSFLQQTNQYRVVDSTDASLCIKDGATATDALHVVSLRSGILVRNIQEDEEADEKIVNEVELTKLPQSVADGCSTPNATVIVPDAVDKMVKIAISNEPSLFSRLSSRSDKVLMLVQREKASLQFQTTKTKLQTKSIARNNAINSDASILSNSGGSSELDYEGVFDETDN